MSVENPMFTGEWPYDAEFAPEPDYKCPRCSEPMEPTQRVYEYNDDEWICGECLIHTIRRLKPFERASMSDESIAYTEQQLEMIDYDPCTTAEILSIEYKFVEDIV